MLSGDTTRIGFDLKYVTCPSCGDNLVSLSRHDFQKCKCPAQSFIDGGQSEYYRVGGMQVGLLQIKLGDFIIDLKTDERILIDEIMKDVLPTWKKTRLLKQEEARKERAAKVKLDIEQGV